jgi:hypothetical protein
MTMSNTRKAKVGKSKATWIPKGYDWGLYFWRLPNGHLFHDGQGNLLNIPSMKNDISKIAELRKAAAHYGQPDGEPWFYAGIKRATDEEHSEQVQRLKEGYIPNLNDLGAVHAAQQGIRQHGNQE